MTAVSLLARSSSPSDVEIDNAFSQNLCRCGTYERIRKAVRSTAERLKT
jgi:isoquinoline 1-oxidoreductase alpha subunit